MKKIFSMLGILLSLGAFAQNPGEIEGKIVDENGAPLPFVNIVATAGTKEIGTSTDLDGKFSIKPLSPGQYDVTASFVGYRDFIKTGVAVDAGRITRLSKIEMLDATVEIGGAVIETWAVDLISKDEPSVIDIKSVTIEQMPIKNNIVGLITALAPGAAADPNTGELYFRGSRAGTTQYFIDGIKYTGISPKVPTSALSSVSVYSGGIPAKFGDVTGGVVWLETKSYFELHNERKNELRAMGYEVD